MLDAALGVNLEVAALPVVATDSLGEPDQAPLDQVVPVATSRREARRDLAHLAALDDHAILGVPCLAPVARDQLLKGPLIADLSAGNEVLSRRVILSRGRRP